MRVLIAGGAGFLGSHLCEYHAERGYQVVVVDNLITGRESNLSSLKDTDAVQFINGDVAQVNELKMGFDVVFHLACPASPKDYQAHPVETMQAESLGTFATLEVARRNNATYVLASTSEIYGDPEVHPQPESYWGNVNPVGPRSSYDESKRFAEALSLAYFREYYVDVRIARIFNTYGPRMRPDDGRVVPTFINQALANQPMTVFGDGSQTRSLCYVSDTSQGLFRLSVAENLEERIFNIGGHHELRVDELAQLVNDLTGAHVPIEFHPLPQDDPLRRRPDIDRARRLLNWEPQTPLEEGLRRTIDHFKFVSGHSPAGMADRKGR